MSDGGLSFHRVGKGLGAGRLEREVVEEAVCQACEKLFPGEGVCWEVVFFQRESSTSYRALRLPDLACCRDPEREVKH
jgi:hypothetical protein